MKIGKLSVHAACALTLSASALAGAAAPASDEELVGTASAAKILGSTRLLASRTAQDYVNLLGASLAALSERPQLAWRFAVLDSPDLNAFAAPGGIVFVTSGLFKLLESEDELAAVLCHEIGHVVRKHHYNVIVRQRLAEQATRQMAKAEQDRAMNELSRTSSVIFARGLDKTAEFEADRHALQLLAAAGYDASAMLGVLEKLGKLPAADSRAELLFATHPSPADRLEQVARSNLDELPPALANAVRSARFRRARSML